MLKHILPWQRQPWTQVFSAPEGLPHALLVHGPKGIGKLQFSHVVARALLCEHPGPDHNPCGACVACHWCHQETHPDFRLLQPESLSQEDAEGESTADEGSIKSKSGSTQISVSQVRQLSGFMDLSACRGARKVVVLHPAEDLNVSAANALLKMLEEPPRGTVFLLVSHGAHRILPTVRSRCRRLSLRVPPLAEGIAWLAEQGIEDPLPVLSEAGFAPLQALENARGGQRDRRKDFVGRLADGTLDPVGHAATLEKGDLPQVLGWLHKWIYDLLAMRLTGRTRYNPDFSTALRRISERVDVMQLGRLCRTLVMYQSTLGHPLNARLVFEHLFFLYIRCVHGQPE